MLFILPSRNNPMIEGATRDMTVFVHKLLEKHEPTETISMRNTSATEAHDFEERHHEACEETVGRGEKIYYFSDFYSSPHFLKDEFGAECLGPIQARNAKEVMKEILLSVMPSLAEEANA